MHPLRLLRLSRLHRLACVRLACVLMLASLPAGASAGDYGRFGPYVGVGGSLSLDFFEDEVEDALDDVVPGIEVDVDEAWGANARAGLRLWSPLAVEVQYEWLSPYDVSVAPFGSFELEQHVVTGNLKLYLPIWRVQPYLLAGAGIQVYSLEGSVGPIDIDQDESAFAARAGAGLDVYLTRNVVLNGEATALLSNETIETDIPGADDIHGLHYLSVQMGLQYRF